VSGGQLEAAFARKRSRENYQVGLINPFRPLARAERVFLLRQRKNRRQPSEQHSFALLRLLNTTDRLSRALLHAVVGIVLCRLVRRSLISPLAACRSQWKPSWADVRKIHDGQAMAELLLELLAHILLRTALGLFVGVPTFCTTLAWQLVKGCSISTAFQAAWKNACYIFAGCFEG
jgi:hypothetical protein